MEIKRRLVIGDPHGGRLAFDQVLERANYDPEGDELIILGDVADGWPQVAELFDDIISMENIVYIMGNHDMWLLDWLSQGMMPKIWTTQGGDASIKSYEQNESIDRLAHRAFLLKAKPYYIDQDNNLFVHGGYDWHSPIEDQDVYDLMWDRHLFVTAHMWEKHGDGNKVDDYNEVFIGHTTTSRSDPSLKPVHVSNVWALDQGGGWEGKLTLMNISSKEYWQSDLVKDLYPNVKGR